MPVVGGFVLFFPSLREGCKLEPVLHSGSHRHSWSWNHVRQELRPMEILAEHLRGLRRRWSFASASQGDTGSCSISHAPTLSRPSGSDSCSVASPVPAMYCLFFAKNSGLWLTTITWTIPLVGARMGPSAIRKALQHAFNRPTSMFHVHCHEHSGPPRFSRVDARQIRLRTAVTEQPRGVGQNL